MLATAALLAWALAVAILDLRSRRIGNRILLVAVIPAVLCLIWRGHGLAGQDWWQSALGLLVSGAVFLPGFLLKACGGGDVKFAAVCGGIVGPAGGVVMMLVAMATLGLVSATTLVLHRAPRELKRRIPAGPAIATGFAVALLLGLQKG